MQEFWYYELGTKFLLVKDERGELKYRFNLTKMGFEHINSFAELQELFPVSYDYKSGKSIEQLWTQQSLTNLLGKISKK